MSEIIPVTKDQLFEKKIAENTGSDYSVGDISNVVPVTKDQALLKEIALNSAGQSGVITELEGKVADNASAIEAIVNVTGACNLAPRLDFTSKVIDGVTWTVISENGSNDGKIIVNGTASAWSVAQTPKFYLPAGSYHLDSGSQDIHNIYLVVVDENDSTYYANTVDVGSLDFTMTSGKIVSVHCVIRNGQTVNNEVFYAMLYDARLNPTGYVPYAMTNEQLTDGLNTVKEGLSVVDAATKNFHSATIGFTVKDITVPSLDEVTTSGIYAFNANTVNAPGIKYGELLVMRGGSVPSDTWWIIQVAFCTDGHVYFRTGTADQWREII